MKYFSFLFLFVFSLGCFAQNEEEPARIVKSVVLDSLVITANPLMAEDFIREIEKDTLFYRAFADLKFYEYLAENKIYTYDKKGRKDAFIYRKVDHVIRDSVHISNVLLTKDSGDVFKRNGDFELFTVQMLSYLFNMGGEINLSNAKEYDEKSDGVEGKLKEKLKLLIARPGTRIDGIPFISGKTAIFEPDMRQYYDYTFHHATYRDTMNVYRFECILKKDLKSNKEDDLIINELTTIFDKKTFNIVARYIDVSYKSMLADCDIRMNFELAYVGRKLLTEVVEYDGYWDIPFRKKEKVSFKVVHDFSKTK
ncbi:MAG: hypothetical protein ACJATA_000502 [Sphingobacteriales bacterium]|jgi:hypothetical protein